MSWQSCDLTSPHIFPWHYALDLSKLGGHEIGSLLDCRILWVVTGDSVRAIFSFGAVCWSRCTLGNQSRDHQIMQECKLYWVGNEVNNLALFQTILIKDNPALFEDEMPLVGNRCLTHMACWTTVFISIISTVEPFISRQLRDSISTVAPYWSFEFLNRKEWFNTVFATFKRWFKHHSNDRKYEQRFSFRYVNIPNERHHASL